METLAETLDHDLMTVPAFAFISRGTMETQFGIMSDGRHLDLKPTELPAEKPNRNVYKPAYLLCCPTTKSSRRNVPNNMQLSEEVFRDPGACQACHSISLDSTDRQEVRHLLLSLKIIFYCAKHPDFDKKSSPIIKSEGIIYPT